MDETRRAKEKKNDAFGREELGELLRMFSALGLTVALGIVGFFLLGLYAERKLASWGIETHSVVKIGFLLIGLGLSIYWAYLRIAKHLDKFDPKDEGV